MQEPGSGQGPEPSEGPAPEGEKSQQAPPPKELLSPGARNFLKDYWSEARLILFKPKAFFDTMPTEGGMRDPLVFAAIALGVNGVLGMVTTFGMFPLVMYPVGLISVALGAVVANALAGALGGKGTFEGTFRVLAYGTVPWLFGWIPIPLLATLAAVCYSCFLNFIGLRKIHELSEAKTLVVVILPTFIVGFILGMAGCVVLIKSIFHF